MMSQLAAGTSQGVLLCLPGKRKEEASSEPAQSTVESTQQ